MQNALPCPLYMLRNKQGGFLQLPQTSMHERLLLRNNVVTAKQIGPFLQIFVNSELYKGMQKGIALRNDARYRLLH